MSSNSPSDNPEPIPVAKPVPAESAQPQVIVQQEKTALGKYGKYLLILVVLLVMSLVGMQAKYESYFTSGTQVQEKYHSLNKEAKKKIAIIKASGTIVEDDDFVKKQIDQVKKDKSVVAIVLRINSPGGTVTQSDYLYHHLRELITQEDRSLPMVVSMGSMCASGGYYLAMAVGDKEDAIFAEPSTWTGSIGVVIPHYDFSGLLANYNVKDDSIASNKKKLMGSPTRVLSPEEKAEERQLLQKLVDISFERFKEIVLAGRPALVEDEDALTKATTGEIFTATQALELGLVDKIGFIESAIERAATLANYDVEELRCVRYEKPPMTLNDVLSAQAPQRNVLTGDLQSLLDLTAPRAYYLCTWLPSVLSNSRP